jgi:SARP family transcriptional regulator, regulator of embCAB operon
MTSISTAPTGRRATGTPGRKHPTAFDPERDVLRFSVLGPFEVFRGDRSITPQARKLRLLLATLVMRHGTVVSIESLIDELWGDNPPRTVVQALRVYVSQLRQLLSKGSGPGEPLLLTQSPGYRLEINDSKLDAVEFDRHCRRAQLAQREGRAAAAVDSYRSALRLWKGNALVDVRSGPVLESAALWLEEARSAARERRIDLELQLRRHVDLVPELRSLTVQQPLNEGLHTLLMIALHRSGRPGEALNVYRGLRTALVRELGVEPGRSAQRVHHAMLTADHTALDRPDLWR